MSDRTHVIEIDRIVLTEVDLQNPGRLSAPLEAEVLRALSGSDLGTLTGVADSEIRVAGEVARNVMQSVQGGSDGV